MSSWIHRAKGTEVECVELVLAGSSQIITRRLHTSIVGHSCFILGSLQESTLCDGHWCGRAVPRPGTTVGRT